MKLRYLWAGVAVFGQVALAQGAAPDAKKLGITEAIVSYCSKVDPAAAAHYRERIKAVAAGATPEQLAQVRKSSEYEKAHASVDEFVAKVDEHNSRKVCAEPRRGTASSKQ